MPRITPARGTAPPPSCDNARHADYEQLRAELAAAREEIRELKAAVVAMCDVYSANRAEKLRVKAYRKHAATDERFTLADVTKTFEALEAKADADPRRQPR